MTGRVEVRKFIAAIVLVFATSQIDAATINFAGYTYNDATNVVVGGGLEWLRWTETDGQSINQALTTYGPQGWQIASNAQMAALFNAFKFTNVPIGAFDSDENTHQFFGTGSDGPTTLASDPEPIFVSMFGNTDADFVGDDNAVDGIERSGAIFGHDLDNDSVYNQAYVIDDYTSFTGQQVQGIVVLGSEIAQSFWSQPSSGVGLVRVVPLPPSVWLLGSALVGIATFSRKNRNNT